MPFTIIYRQIRWLKKLPYGKHSCNNLGNYRSLGFGPLSSTDCQTSTCSIWRNRSPRLRIRQLILLRQIAFMVRCKTDMLSGLIRKSPLAPLFPPGQAPPRLPARRVLQLGEKGSCPGGRPYGPAAKEGDNNFPLWQRGNKGDFVNCRCSTNRWAIRPPD